jgi:hypothetical protein
MPKKLLARLTTHLVVLQFIHIAFVKQKFVYQLLLVAVVEEVIGMEGARTQRPKRRKKKRKKKREKKGKADQWLPIWFDATYSYSHCLPNLPFLQPCGK